MKIFANSNFISRNIATAASMRISTSSRDRVSLSWQGRSSSLFCLNCGHRNLLNQGATKVNDLNSVLDSRIYFSTSFVKCMAGHSHWANIKFKKMHKDAERSKKFGKLSLEIIQAVKENGPDPISNSKLDGIISRAKAVKMPKDSIESAIKSGLRVGSETKVQLTLEIRGPGRCALLLDVLSSNIKRTRPELNTILKKYGGTQSEEGSVSFMFQCKGIVTAERSSNGDASVNKVEDAAILCGAENFYFDTDEDGNDVIRFVCAPLDFGAVQNSLCSEHGFHVISANDELVAVKLVDLDENQMQQADKLIDQLSSHPDVMRIFDNIRKYPSSTLKRDNPF